MASKTTPRSGSNRAGKPGKKPLKPVRAPRPWGLISLGVAVVVAAAGMITYAAIQAKDAGQPFPDQPAQQVEGVVNFRDKDPDMLTRNHVEGPVEYKIAPPVGGDHNTIWQNCQGDVYAAQIANEHAVHSLEHGAVWITYRPNLPAAQVDALADKVRGNDYMLMSPYPGLDKAVSVQAWGFQLKVDDASDERIDKFIRGYVRKSSVEPGATCGQGITQTGTAPASAGGMQSGS
jgi:hypothetical protein